MSKQPRDASVKDESHEHVSNGSGDLANAAVDRSPDATRAERIKGAATRAGHKVALAGNRALRAGDHAAGVAKDVAPDVAEGTTRVARLMQRHPVPSAISGAFVLGFAKGRKRGRRRGRS